MAKGNKSPRDTHVHNTALLTNLSATIILAALIALGVYVNINNLIVADTSSNGYQSVNLDTTSWNVACTIVGTAIGILATIGFSSQDDIITRRELASDDGVRAMFLRPLTLRRGLEQIIRLQLPVERTLLVLLTVVTALTSATVVALFGIRSTTEVIINPFASFPLASLNQSFFENSPLSGVAPIGPSPASLDETSQLSGFLYKLAYITGMKMKGDYDPYNNLYLTYLPEQGPLGDNIYATLNTGGIGLNTSSYLQWSGQPDGFNMPAKFEFDGLRAHAFGTNVSVSCDDVTHQCTVKENTNYDFGTVVIQAIWKLNGGPNITMFAQDDWDHIGNNLAIGSAVTIDDQTGDPTHTIAIPRFGIARAAVLECTWNGREYLAEVSLTSPVSALTINHVVEQGPYLGPAVKQRLANITDNLLKAGMGGNLARGFVDADYNADGTNSTGIALAIEPIFEQLGEPWFSLIRQSVERSNLYDGAQFGDHGAKAVLYAKVNRLGGGQFGWLAVLGVLILGTAFGSLRACVGRASVDFEAQDTVKLLRSTLQDASICDTSRARYRDRFEIAGNERRDHFVEVRYDEPKYS